MCERGDASPVASERLEMPAPAKASNSAPPAENGKSSQKYGTCQIFLKRTSSVVFRNFLKNWLNMKNLLALKFSDSYEFYLKNQFSIQICYCKF